MAGMKAGESRRQSILNDLMTHEYCTYEYLMERYQISERSMQLDIKSLIAQGYQIKGVKAKRGYILTKTEETKESQYFENSDAQKLRKVFLMHVLMNEAGANGLRIEEIMEKAKAHNWESGFTADVKTVQTALHELAAEHMVVAHGDRYEISVNAPVQLSFGTTEAIDLLNRLEQQSKGHYYEETLAEIRRKLAIALFNEPEEDNQFSNYVVYQRSFETAKKLATHLEELNKYPFEQKELLISFNGKRGSIEKLPVAVGNVVYSVEKDRLYLIGETKTGPIIIQYETITHMEVGQNENHIFQNAMYQGIVEDMFSISVEPAVHVKVEFENIFRIGEKLRQVVANRPKAYLYEEDGFLIYEDDVRGLYDFAAFLRRFGSSCKVIEPPALVNLMVDSAKRILEAYEGLEVRHE